MRKISSIILVLAFFAVGITGILLEFSDEHFIKELHVSTGLIMLIAGFVHLSYIVRPMMTGRKN